MKKSKITSNIEEARIDYFDSQFSLQQFCVKWQTSNTTAYKLFGQKPPKRVKGVKQSREQILERQRIQNAITNNGIEENYKKAQEKGLSLLEIKKLLLEGWTFKEIFNGEMINGKFRLKDLFCNYRN